ncbi:hypothetical protein AUP68_14009 [Ilyonectria robusta]
MATTSKMIEEMATRFEKSMQDLKEELNKTEFYIEEESIKDDWDMKTLLIMLSECLVIMGVFFEATGTCVKMYGCRIRLASKHKATGATRTDPVVSYPELPLTKTVSPESNGQTPEAAIPPPGPKRGRTAKPKGPTMTGGQCGPQPPPTTAVRTPNKRSKNSQPSPPLETPASLKGKKTQQCIDQEKPPLSPPTESPAAEEVKGLPAKARRGKPRKTGAEVEEPPLRRSTRQRKTRLDGEHEK